MEEENVQNQAISQAAEVEKKVTEQITNIENSKLASNLPTDVQSLHITDIIKLIFFTGIVNFFPLFLIFGTEFSSKFDFLRKILHLFFITFFVGSMLVTMCCFISGAQELYKFVVVVMFCKDVLGAILLLMFSTTSLTNLVFAFLYLAYILIQDLALLYYMGIYLKRLQSDKYDDYGVKIVRKEQEKV